MCRYGLPRTRPDVQHDVVLCLAISRSAQGLLSRGTRPIYKPTVYCLVRDSWEHAATMGRATVVADCRTGEIGGASFQSSGTVSGVSLGAGWMSVVGTVPRGDDSRITHVGTGRSKQTSHTGGHERPACDSHDIQGRHRDF